MQKDINPQGLYVFYQNGSDSNTNFFQLAQFPLELEEKVSKNYVIIIMFIPWFQFQFSFILSFEMFCLRDPPLEISHVLSCTLYKEGTFIFSGATCTYFITQILHHFFWLHGPHSLNFSVPDGRER